MIKMIKDAILIDSYLGNLHVLMLMDDTVIMATSREACKIKFESVLKFCDEFGMELNVSKTKFFVINSEPTDKEPLIVGDKVINYCWKYLYLGAWFTDDAKTKSALKLHENNLQDNLNKFIIFCKVNTEMPYYYKSLVMDAAVVSSIFYGCESWLTENPDIAIKTYNQLLKRLLGVRPNTSPDLCLIESGKSPAKAIIQNKLKNFLEKKFRHIDMEEPFHMVYI